jgi:tetratricopeptide (TPR) repeat protein
LYQLQGASVLVRNIVIFFVLVGYASAPNRSLADDLCSVSVFETDAKQAAASCTSILDNGHLTTAARVEALKIRARAFNRMGQLDDAITDYEEALKLAPDDAELHVYRGWRALDKEDFDLAFAQARRALQLKPEYAEVYALVGAASNMSRCWCRNFAKAKAADDEAIRLQPLRPLYRFNRLLLFETNGFDNEAIGEADTILRLPAPLITKPAEVESYLKPTTYRIAVEVKRGILLRSAGRIKEAEQGWDHAVELDPDALTYAMRAEFRMSQTAFIPFAPLPPMTAIQDDLDKAFALDPDYWFTLNLQAKLHLLRGEFDSATAHGEYELAAAYYARALKGYPINGGMRWNYAVTLRNLGRSDEAVAEATTAFRLDPGFMEQKLGYLREQGYFTLTASDTDPRPAVMDAVRACMLDERCG